MSWLAKYSEQKGKKKALFSLLNTMGNFHEVVTLRLARRKINQTKALKLTDLMKLEITSCRSVGNLIHSMN
jgi:hypothetical protein